MLSSNKQLAEESGNAEIVTMFEADEKLSMNCCR
jgi:hypothetical protein